MQSRFVSTLELLLGIVGGRLKETKNISGGIIRETSS